MTVTKVVGNRVFSERVNGQTRVRDKSQLKRVGKRPCHLRPSWEQRPHNCPTDYSQFEIDCKSDNEEQQKTDDANQETWSGEDTQLEQLLCASRERVEKEDASEKSDDDTGDGEFEVSQEMTDRLQSLIRAAEQRTDPVEPVSSGCMTRSKGMKLNWNPVMNEGEVLIETGEQP